MCYDWAAVRLMILAGFGISVPDRKPAHQIEQGDVKQTMIQIINRKKVAVFGVWLLGVLWMGILGACGGSAGQPMEQSTVMQEQPTPLPTATEEEPDPQPTQVENRQPTPTAGDSTILVDQEPEPTNVPAEEEVADAGPKALYRIDPEKSEARFKIDELLFGEPKTVVGRTNRIEGEIRLRLSDPHSAEISPIRIDALGLRTDDSFRNRSLRRFILESRKEEYRYIVFEPTSIEGLPDEVVLGQAIPLRVTGNLRIRDITRPVTFDVVVVPESEDRLTGSGSTTVLRSDFDLKIPRVPGVASVSEEVILEFDFVAERVEEDG